MVCRGAGNKPSRRVELNGPGGRTAAIAVGDYGPRLRLAGCTKFHRDAVIGIMEEVLEAQNMNLGNDLASKDGRVTFKSSPVVYAPKLDSDTQNPVYLLDWKYLAIGVMAGWENNLGKPYMVPGKHLVRRVDLDVTLQMIATDLRRHAVLYKP